MTETNQKQLGNTLWKIADDLRGAIARHADRLAHGNLQDEYSAPALALATRVAARETSPGSRFANETLRLFRISSARVELTTFGFGGRRSIQLSYEDMSFT